MYTETDFNYHMEELKTFLKYFFVGSKSSVKNLNA